MTPLSMTPASATTTTQHPHWRQECALHTDLVSSELLPRGSSLQSLHCRHVVRITGWDGLAFLGKYASLFVLNTLRCR
ncbi:hypothetical protein AC579_227 [Pseudocercospora musae]|uniref:Uncharacterized protein n=1 Tax=Pseudocercospora musae TaxID=113226 RepID=A0A139IA40_9PEZI|nr:hypothetical protein AC579_227 [Pseudocercospora musae]